MRRRTQEREGGDPRSYAAADWTTLAITAREPQSQERSARVHSLPVEVRLGAPRPHFGRAAPEPVRVPLRDPWVLAVIATPPRSRGTRCAVCGSCLRAARVRGEGPLERQ